MTDQHLQAEGAFLMPLKEKYLTRKLGWKGSSKRASNSGKGKKAKNPQGNGPRRRQGPGAWDALIW